MIPFDDVNIRSRGHVTSVDAWKKKSKWMNPGYADEVWIPVVRPCFGLKVSLRCFVWLVGEVEVIVSKA